MNAAHTSGSFDWRRRNMVQRLAKMGISRADVLAAMGNVPRHVFVEEALRSRAYDDMSLPLGLGQTISQPYTVAVMTQLMLGCIDNPLLAVAVSIVEQVVGIEVNIGMGDTVG
mgnify:CR=1 FL=1